MSTNAIGDYALLSDRHSAALVSLDGSIDWLCFPRFDSPSIFARLLGEQAGYWSVRAPGSSAVTRRYLDRTMVLETIYRTATGTAVVVDALAMGEGNRGHDLGRDAPHLLLRQVTCSLGEVAIEVEYVPRPEYGPRAVGPTAARDEWDAPPALAPATGRFLIELADTAARRWQEKDRGIWEVRGEPRHFVYSKVMCWVALERATALAERLGASHRVEDWARTQDRIHQAILSEGWSDRVNAFTQSFGSDDLDASNLMLPLVGFLPADDPRMLSTIDVTEERLTDKRGLVYRYRARDGLDGEEGAFLLCTFWLAQALAVAGRPERARIVFERAAAFVNDVGLLAEEVDPISGELLGNFPQAFSHIGLVNAAWAISEAEAARRS